MLKNPQTGKTEVVYENRKTSIQFWLSTLLQVIAIGTVVFAAARFGLVVETKAVIEEELLPTGVIYERMEDCVEDHIMPFQEEIQKLEHTSIIQSTIQLEIRDDIKEIKESVKEIQRDGT